MVFPFNSSGKGDDHRVDFNYPQDVSKAALSDLDKALASGDGQKTVDALVRYSIAQSGISEENMPEIVKRLEATIAREKQPHIKALLYYFEALAYQGYRDSHLGYGRHNPVGETPTDISEWDDDQFDIKIAELIDLSLADRDALKQVPVTSLPDIIKCDKLGATYVPTLLEFMLMKDRELAKRLEHDASSLKLGKEWVDATEYNVPAHLYAITVTGGYFVDKKDYEKYKYNEHSAMLLNKGLSLDNKEKYALLKDYVQRFPDGIYTNAIKNEITELESRSVSLTYPEVLSTRDSVTVKAYVRNANAFTIKLLRVPDKLLDKNYFKISDLELVSTHQMTAQGIVPFTASDIKLTVPPLPCGCYFFQAYVGPDGVNTSDRDPSMYNVMRITDIAAFSISREDSTGHVATVDITNGRPIKGVDIKGEKKTYGTTDTQGLLKLKLSNDNSYSLYAVKGNDKYGPSFSYYPVKNYDHNSVSAEVYTDLGVYRPGETIRWATIVYKTADNGRKTLANTPLRLIFKDSNWKEIDTVDVTTDAYGRAEGKFTVPKDRMNGRFSIQVSRRNGGNLTTRYINVSEYKTPTFEVTFPGARRSYVNKQPVKVTGQAMTYSGMPLANTEVRLSLVKNEWSWWWWRNNNNKNGTHLNDTTLTTDAEGKFTIEYEPELFEENKSAYGRSRYNYEIDATVTDGAGETHEASTTFIIGTRRGIEFGEVNDNIFLNDKPITLPITYNTTSETETSTWCTWEVIPDGKQEPVKTGNFNTADPTIDLTSLPSGQYTVKVHILDAKDNEDDVDAQRDITIYRSKDKTPPVKDCPLWIAPQGQSVDKDNKGHIKIGVSTPEAHIYYIAWSQEGVISEGWLDYTAGMHEFTVPLPKKAGCNVTVEFNTFYGLKAWNKTVRLNNPYKAEAMKVAATSFRDKLVPGDTEHWTFTLTDQNGNPRPGAMMLDMYDKAISTIAENDWSFGNWRPSRSVVYTRLMIISGNNSTSADWSGMTYQSKISLKIPYLYTYGQELFSYRMSDMVRCESDPVMICKAAPTAMAGGKSMGDDAVRGASGLSESNALDEEAKVNEKNFDNIILRENDVKTALWQPMLVSDEAGNISVEFEVPNFNTTWNTQAVAWDKQMHGNSWLAEVLTQKPLMVRSSLPRFVRQGDKARLAANVQNATDEPARCDAVIEIFDPRSGEIYATRNFSLQLEGKGSQAVNIDWTVPDTIAMAGFRIKAANGRFGDGEQVMLPVLTTISPVIETQPFYIEAAEPNFEMPLPAFPKDARVTLEYCDNPTWYCVLALPTIFDDNYEIATSAAHSLFALQVAQGVAKSQPQIKEAVNWWNEHHEDSTLVSMLEKNQDLKIGTLLASPWMRDADRQTLRMSRLGELFDEVKTAQEYEKIIAALKSLQMSDGGFTWFKYPDCRSSVWTTGTVLELLGETKHLGYLPNDSRLNDMIAKAIKYFDKENLRLLKEALKYDKDPYGSFSDYAYVRSLYPETALPKDNADMMKKVLKSMNKNWGKGLTLKEKAYYAMTLNRNGYPKTARDIIESIRQFAITKPNLGMYWDNLQTGRGWWEFDKVAYTSAILQAMNEIEPRQQEIDQIRKWMLLMKQSNDWGSRSLAADAVCTILSTGSQWLERAANPVITVAGQAVNLDNMAQWLGYFRTTLDATTTGSVVIDRTASGPAWGAVYTQYKAPMTSIKEVSIDEVSISKEYYVYAQDGSLHPATSFKVGDKVKVRTVIKVNKDMDYVTVTDERASCFEPLDQLSGYRSEDRTWFYQETKDSQTNLFFNSLNKGTHIIGYDVWVNNAGEFTSGIATIQCQYAPQLSAHSAGKTIVVEAE